MNLKGKIAIVTGGNKGIGRAISISLAKHGVEVVVADVNIDNLNNSTGKKFFGVKTDVSSSREVDNLIKEVMDKFRKIDILVNNAGVSSIGRIWEISEKDFDWNFSINTKGVFLCSKAVVPIMIKQGSGCIINISSRAGKVPVEFQGHYGATKAAVILLTMNFAAELAPFGIRVNAICPGKVNTGMIRAEWEEETKLRNKSIDEIERDVINKIPMKRLVSPEDVAKVVIFLASDYSAAMTGQSINVSCGLEMR